MNTKTTTFIIEKGPSRDAIVDVFKYSFDKNAIVIQPRFQVWSEDLQAGHDTIRLYRIYNLTWSDENGEELTFRALAGNDHMSDMKVWAEYNIKTRTGKMYTSSAVTSFYLQMA